MDITYLTRKEWAAEEALPRLGSIVQGDERTEVYIHHTVAVDNDATPNVWETTHEVVTWMRRLQTIRPDLGLDVPYSVVAFFKPNELVICEGRGASRQGAHTKYHNRTAIGLAVHGNFQLPTFGLEGYVQAMGAWLHRLKVNQLPFLGTTHPPGRDVFGHRDSAQTSCPGSHLYDMLGKLKIEEEDDVAITEAEFRRIREETWSVMLELLRLGTTGDKNVPMKQWSDKVLSGLADLKSKLDSHDHH